MERVLALDEPRNSRTTSLIFIFVLGLALRVFASTLGSTFDFESYQLVYKGLLEGTLPWETRRYNYGSVWAFVVFTAGKLSMSQVDLFRFIIIFVLCSADWVNSRFIRQFFSSKFGYFYFLNPISIMISGYYMQFDTLAIAFAVLAITHLMQFEALGSKKNLHMAVFFLSLSLMTKHVFAVFLIWLFFRYKGKVRFYLAVVPLSIFLLHFFPIALLGKWRVVWEQVFLYWSANNAPLWRFFVRDQGLVNQIGDHNAWHHGRLWMMLFLATMIIFGFITRNCKLKKLLAIYTICIVIFSSAITTQFYAIAAFGVFCLFNLAFLYFLIGGFYMTLVGPNGPLQNSSLSDGFPISAWDFPPHALLFGATLGWLIHKRPLKFKAKRRIRAA